jgi:hypothetical protein
MAMDYAGNLSLASGGKLGIGMTPANIVDITQSLNGFGVIQIANTSAGISASAGFQINNSSSGSTLYLLGNSYTAAGMNRPNGYVLSGNGAGGLSLITTQPQPIYFGINTQEVGRFDASGNLLVGTLSATAKLTVEGATSVPIMSVINRSGASGGAGIGFNFVAALGGTDAGDLTFYTTQNSSGANATEKARLLNSGGLLVGYTTSNGAYNLQVNGQIFATSATIATSDAQFKTNIVPLADGALSLICALKPSEFDFQPDDVHNFPTGRQIGFIAQDVQTAFAGADYLGALVFQNTQEAIPAIVAQEAVPAQAAVLDETGQIIKLAQDTQPAVAAQAAIPSSTFLGLADASFTPLIVKAVQELSALVTTLQATVTAQAAAIAALQSA